ncbi:MAG: hypothetical protein JWN99_2652, partial [Ilumatobacteraceae bacterium]|nr:hypothetical protein [Ilumatobacteraceae bacterium]
LLELMGTQPTHRCVAPIRVDAET